MTETDGGISSPDIGRRDSSVGFGHKIDLKQYKFYIHTNGHEDI